MTDKPDQLAIDLLRLLLSYIEAKPDSERREFAGEIHRIIVLVDDRLCDSFNFSRRGRNKKVDKTD